MIIGHFVIKNCNSRVLKLSNSRYSLSLFPIYTQCHFQSVQLNLNYLKYL